MKRYLVLIVLLFLLSACIVEPLPISPLPTPPVSPLPVSEMRADNLQPTKTEEVQMTLPEMLAMVAAGGLLGGVVSFLFERFTWFQKLSPDGRFWMIGALSIGLPVIATALILYVPAEVWTALEPFWQAVFAGGAAWLGGQFVHKRLKR